MRVILFTYEPGEPSYDPLRLDTELEILPRTGDVVTTPDGRDWNVKQVQHDYSGLTPRYIVELRP